MDIGAIVVHTDELGQDNPTIGRVMTKVSDTMLGVKWFPRFDNCHTNWIEMSEVVELEPRYPQ